MPLARASVTAMSQKQRTSSALVSWWISSRDPARRTSSSGALPLRILSISPAISVVWRSRVSPPATRRKRMYSWLLIRRPGRSGQPSCTRHRASIRRSSRTTPKPGRSRKPAMMSHASSWSAERRLSSRRSSSAGQRARSRGPFDSPLADARMRSKPLRIVAAVILFFLLLLAGWVNTIPICLRAVSSASAEAFGSIGAFAPAPAPHRARPRRLGRARAC